MRENRSYGSVRGALREERPYRNSGFELQDSSDLTIPGCSNIAAGYLPGLSGPCASIRSL